MQLITVFKYFLYVESTMLSIACYKRKLFLPKIAFSVFHIECTDIFY